MKCLLTSGGTKIRIDMVRSISNMSKGTFGTKLADEFLRKGWYVDFLAARDSKTPFGKRVEDGVTVNEWVGCRDSKIRVTPYTTFDEYERELFRLLEENEYDVVILAAAVSDYGVVNYVDGKVHSSEDMSIQLKPLPKLISRVRGKAEGSYLVGFKLLVNSTQEELNKAMVSSFYSNRLDLIVGNDLRDIKRDNHTLTLLDKEGTFMTMSKEECVVTLQEFLVGRIINGWKDKHAKEQEGA
ncbi:MAG: hypothetical protein J6Y62_05825 [Clostridia bacterium]|nr:hypothetical protein [Clostridia bacterium]